MVAASEIDVLIVRAGTTLGHLYSESELVSAVEATGATVAIASPDYTIARKFRFAYPFIDFAEAAAMTLAVRRAVRHQRPRAVIYPTSLSVLFEPTERLARSAVRFDALAIENRPGARNALQHHLERRALRSVRVLLPFSTRLSRSRRDRLPLSAKIVSLPTPISSRAELSAQRSRDVLSYAANPTKRGLDVVVRAWELASLRDRRLMVAGVDERTARAFLRSTPIPSSISWLGTIPHERFRDLTSSVDIFLAAARYEDYGIAPLEALTDGALLVTVPSEGPFEALQLARTLRPDLVARDCSPRALATALRYADAISPEDAIEYRRQAYRMSEPYGREAFRRAIAERVLPLLLGNAGCL
jgi:hypothetical protein